MFKYHAKQEDMVIKRTELNHHHVNSAKWDTIVPVRIKDVLVVQENTVINLVNQIRPPASYAKKVIIARDPAPTKHALLENMGIIRVVPAFHPVKPAKLDIIVPGEKNVTAVQLEHIALLIM